MKKWTFLIVLITIMSISFLFTETVNATYPDEGTTVPSPWPTVVFVTGKGIDTTQQYSPKVNDICWTWNHIIGRIGNYYVPAGKQLLVIKFLSNQNQILVNNVACENDAIRTPMERAAWANAREPWYYTWDKIVTYYVGANMEIVTLTPTSTILKTSTRTPRPTGTPTATPISAPGPTIVFKTADNDRSIYYYTPQKNELCTTWNDPNGILGLLNIQSNRPLIVVKFLEDQETIPVSITWCEEASNITPEERIAWHIKNQPCCYSWNNTAAYYVGANMRLVTLTPTSTVTNTSIPIPIPIPTATATETETATASSTSTSTPTQTSTSTPTRTSSSTRTNTPTVTPVLAPDKVVPSNVSTLHIPKAGHICFGQVIGDVRNSLVEFVTDYSTGIEISGGGCFTKKYYSLSQVMRYLESRGVKYGYLSLPRPTLTPSRTLPPTATIVRYLAIGIQTDGVKDVILDPGTVCWGKKVGTHEYKVVRFQKGLTTSTRIIVGGCTVGQNLSAEDVYNFLRRVYNTPLNGFVEVR
jgi:hypothetical protein